MALLLALAVILGGFSNARTATADVTDKQVLDTITKQVNFLLSKKTKDHNWEVEKAKYENNGGETALVLYALLYAGRSIEDARLSPKSADLKPALEWLATVTPTGTYAAGLQANALALVPDAIHDPAYRKALERCGNFMVQSVRPDGAYGYTFDWKLLHTGRHGTNNNWWDNSNSQYGLLGAWAAQDAGVEFPTGYWPLEHAHWLKTQQPDGGWAYEAGKPVTLSMTCAGLASLYITTDCADQEPPRLAGIFDPHLEAGLTWMEKNFKATNDAYALYGCERVGLASGRKTLGKTDWYKTGAATIIAGQQAGGHTDLHVTGGSPVINTAYTLLFLCRGRNPILFNKLEYIDAKDPKTLHWNARPRDLANLTHHFADMFEKDFNWHVVNLQVHPQEWLDSPVLLITGCADPNFTPEDVAKLRAFVNAGGIIFSTADGATPAFTTAVKKYAAQICDDKYELRELPKDHPLFHLQYNIEGGKRMLAVSNGVRELWIHSPTDLGYSWQRRAYAQKSDWELPANLYLYATGKVNSREKLGSVAVKPSSSKATKTIALARLEYAGNWNPEPGAWQRMAKLAQAHFGTDLKITLVKASALDASQTPVAHLTGTTVFSLGADGVAALRKYLEGGGTLLADAAGGSTGFSDSFVKLAAELFPNAALDSLPVDHPIFTGKMPAGVDASDAEYRRSTLKKHGRPALLGIQLKGRYVVVFSSFDLTSGLLGTNTWGITGYDPDSAQAIVRNELLYAAGPSGGTASVPTDPTGADPKAAAKPNSKPAARPHGAKPANK